MQSSRIFFCLSVIILIGKSALFSQTPAVWESRGVGGGGAMFAVSINPADDNEFYAGCDMSELFHSGDFGNSYRVLDFRAINGGQNSTVRFTKTPGLLYVINYKMNGNLDQIVPASSKDNGETWLPLPGTPYPTEIARTIFADYEDPLRLIISYYGSVHFSSNGGQTFTEIHTALDNGSGVVVGGVFFDGENIFIGTNDGLIVSHNGGASFATESIGGIASGEKIWSFAGAKQNGITRFFALTSSSGYVGMQGSDYWNFPKNIYSLDYGVGNWAVRSNGLNFSSDFVVFLAMAENDISTCYAGGGSASASPIILKTSDGGASWVQTFLTSNNKNIATGWSGWNGDRAWSYGECVFSLAVAPRNSQKVIFGDFGFLHKSSDGGTSWRQAYLASSDENPANASTPQGKYYHGVGLENTTSWQVLWADNTTMLGCYSDIKGIRSTDGGGSWSFKYSGHNANSMYRVVQSPSGILYAATSNIHDMYQSTRLADAQLDANDAQGKIIYSTDKGATWRDMKNFAHPVFWTALDPNAPNTMYASVIHSTQGGIYVSKDVQNGAAATWTKLPNPPRTQGHPAGIIVLRDGKVLCTYSGRRTSNPAFTASSGCFLYNPSTNSWSDLSDPGMYYWCKDVVLDPNDPTQNTWYVCVFSGWGGAANGKGGLYKTSNRGQSWKRVWDADRVSSCTFHPTKPNEMYVTTEVEGLWFSANANTEIPTFSPVFSYPFRQPERVFFNPYNPNEVWVTSFGNGMKVGIVGGAEKPKAPELLLPQNHRTNIASSPRLEWKPVLSAESYTLQISDNADFSQNVLEQSQISDNAVTTNLANGSTYFWRVKAVNAIGESAWSETWDFSLQSSSSISDGTSNDRWKSNIEFLPEPIGEEAIIRFTVAATARVSLTLFDTRGREVGVITGGIYEAGVHTIRFYPNFLPAGTYCWLFKSGEHSDGGTIRIVK